MVFYYLPLNESILLFAYVTCINQSDKEVGNTRVVVYISPNTHGSITTVSF